MVCHTPTLKGPEFKTYILRQIVSLKKILTIVLVSTQEVVTGGSYLLTKRNSINVL